MKQSTAMETVMNQIREISQQTSLKKRAAM